MRRVLSYWWLSLIVSVGWLVVPASFHPVGHPPAQRARMDVRQLETALELFRQDHGGYPSAGEGLQALLGARILLALPDDPWGSSYVYRVSSAGTATVYSIGQNRTDEDGTGDDVTAERGRQIRGQHDEHVWRHLSGYLLLAVTVASLAVGLVQVALWLRRAALRIGARLRN
jgi:general secretion pathway protein G